MRKVFWDDSYRTELSATVEQVDGNEVIFYRTIAYSFSGGQESDRCWIESEADQQTYEVINSRKEGNLIHYQLSDDHALTPGSPVIMKIDWS